jgi:rfaE bifunctional protein kinase chain/domain
MRSILKAQPALSLVQLAESFPKRKLLVVGDLVADHYLYGETDRVSREAPVLIVRYESSEVKLGGAANVAANARSLGAQVTAVGLVGTDEMGRELRRQLKTAGIRLLTLSPEEPETETKTRILAGGLNTTRQQMLRVDRSPSMPLSLRRRLELARLTAKAARKVDVVVVSDYGARVVNEECRRSLRQLASEGVLVCIDSRHALRSFAGATVCKPNEPELEALTGIQIRSERDLLRAGKAAIEELRCKALLVTRGRHGMAVFDSRGLAELIPVHGLGDAVDVTGAGDTVISALALALSAGAGVVDAARIANVAAALVVQKQGTATVPRRELLEELEGLRS